MRERITFIHGAEDAFDPSQLRLDNDTLYVNSLKAVREDRVTFSPHELPQELLQASKQCYELHLRWVSSATYTSISPFVSKASPGLHVFYTPLRNRPAGPLCPLLRKLFGNELKCVSPEETFTGLPTTSERFASSAAFQYYSLLPSLADLITYIQQKICLRDDKICFAEATTLESADYLDIDYDTISQALVLSIFRHQSPKSASWNEQIHNHGGAVKVEVGVLANEKPTEPEELSLGGFLAVIGEDDKPSYQPVNPPDPTLFSFPARHHLASKSSASIYRASLVPPTGLHPTLRLAFASSSMIPPAETCMLHTYLTLPSFLFPDKYQLSSPLFLSSKNLRSVRSVSGETDLEAPDWVVQKWGSAMLVELAPPPSSPVSESGPWYADIPLHLRYLAPAAGGATQVDVPWPVVFWACTAEEGNKMNVNPFDRVNLGYDGLFGPKTMFYHLEPDTNNTNGHGGLIEHLDIPVLDTASAPWIEKGTVIIVVVGLLWVLSKLTMVLMSGRRSANITQGTRKKSQ
ncbi:protease B nonderepressible form [Lignoscripta atroalba]|nr:protease B nonderepressible form [Lignoscripta atroalba]